MAKFKDVLDALAKGGCIRRTSWRNKAFHYRMNGYGTYVETSGGHAVRLSTELLNADDWEIVEPKVTITRRQLAMALKEAMFDPWLQASSPFISKEDALVGLLAEKLGFPEE